MKNFDVNKATLSFELTEASREMLAKFKQGDEILTKTVSIAEFLTELSRDLEINTGVLPAGTRFYSGTKTVYTIGIQVPAKVRKTEFHLPNHGTLTVSVPFPETMLVFHVNGGRINISKIFSFIPPIGRASDRLYKFPFGNVYENGKICWGNVNLPNISEPVMLDGAVSKFFGSAFSGHLIHGTDMFNPPENVVNLKTLLDHLSGQEHFPEQILKQSGMTVGKALLVGKDNDL